MTLFNIFIKFAFCRLNSCYILLGDSASEFDLVEFYLLHVDTVFYVKGNY